MSEYVPTESEIDAYGSGLAAVYFGISALGVALLTAQLLMVLSGFSKFLRMPKQGRQGRLVFVLISFLILSTSSTETSIDIWWNYQVLYRGGPSGKSYLESNNTTYEKNITTKLVSNVFLVLTVAGGDVLMLWRCFMLWANKAWLVALPCLTCIGCIVCNILAIIWAPTRSNRARTVVIAAVSLSVATNIVITLLILLRLAMTWFHTRRAFPDRNLPRMYINVAAILVESAAPLAIFGILQIVVGRLAQKGRINDAYAVSEWLYYGFCALSPQMIIYRVTSGHSWKNAAESASGVEVVSQPIHFARTATKSEGTESSNDA
ncbi:hypothetical protein BKA70DRAFT_1267282 [Coprinopsis sp. MPI-PUGE-AT-0042]|nr:hypothetical protein BKA70DRAFT_1267282 [Coprinopsis sp. MPI-PUGE-AT-0042]